MPYSTEISRTNPTCFLFLVDQSSSMLEPFGGQQDKKKGFSAKLAGGARGRACG